jgi:pimeloyl-ACP methyl ester carboxylesterase
VAVLLRTFVALAVVALLLLLGVFLMQRRLLYFPTHEDPEGKGDAGFRAWRDAAGAFVGYVREAATPARTVLFFHGNGGEALHRAWLALAVPEATTNVVLVEYPGYGARPGEPTQRTIEAAALAAYDLADAAWHAPIVVVGESLGTGVATFVARSRPVARVALISPFTALLDVAKLHYPLLPVSALLQDNYDSAANLAAVRVPLLVVHGEDDDIVPFRLGKALFDGYAGPDKELLPLAGVGHNDLAAPLVRSPNALRFREFLAKDGD